MSTIDTKYKRPDEVLDYDVDYSRWLESTDTIASISVAKSGSGSVVIDSSSFTDSLVKVWLSAGTDGEENTITVTATTAEARVKEKCFRIKIKDDC